MTKIEWTDESWNPVVGCSIVSPGCRRCYAMRMAARLEAMSIAHARDYYGAPGPLAHYRGLTEESNAGPVWTGRVATAPDHVFLEPLTWRRPRLVFVCSMADLFHEAVPDAVIDRVFAVMALARHHTFQVVTKRAARMRAYVEQVTADRLAAAMRQIPPTLGPRSIPLEWPLPNVWKLVSCEDQKRADERVPELLATPAAVRGVSAEPLLGPIDFTRIDVQQYGYLNALDDGYFIDGRTPRRRLDWIIVGGESGPGARPMHPDWARSIRDQCAAAGTAFFFKQWGAHAWTPDDVCYTDAPKWGRERGFPIGTPFHHHASGHTSFRVGKARAGRLLDGISHGAMPPAPSARSRDD